MKLMIIKHVELASKQIQMVNKDFKGAKVGQEQLEVFSMRLDKAEANLRKLK